MDEGFLLDKKIGGSQPKVIENAKILIANTSMDTDKIKIFGSRVRVDSTAKLAEIEQAEKEKMKAVLALNTVYALEQKFGVKPDHAASSS